MFKGKGLEFDTYREYVSGDDSNLIDWKASKRANKTLIKEFTEERSLDVFILFDVSDSMIFGSAKKLKNVYGAELVASLSYAMINADDSVGLALFNGDIIRFSLPIGGMKQYYNILDIITDLDLYGGHYNLEKSLEFAMNNLSDGALLIIVSDFIGEISQRAKELMRICGEKFQVIGIMIRDPVDRVMPYDVGQVFVSNPSGTKKVVIEPKKIRDVYEVYARQQESEIKVLFRESKADLISLITDKPFVGSIITFFRGRLEK